MQLTDFNNIDIAPADCQNPPKLWDFCFSANVDGDGYQAENACNGDVDENEVAHASYGHQAFSPRRIRKHWDSNRLTNNNIIICNRGPLHGGMTHEAGSCTGNPIYNFKQDSYTLSPTLQFHGDEKQWEGRGAAGDGSLTILTSVVPEGILYQPSDDLGVTVDNLFAAEFNDATEGCQASADTWIVMQSGPLFINPQGSSMEFWLDVEGAVCWDPTEE